MIDPEIKKELDKVNANLVAILHKTESTWWALVRGALHGFGTVIGILFAILLIGWILNIMGILPGFKQQAEKFQTMWQQTLDQAAKIR